MRISHRPYLAKLLDEMDEEKQIRKQRLEKNLTGDVPIEKFYTPLLPSANTHRFTTSTTTLPPTTSPKSTLVFTFRYGFVFEEIVGKLNLSGCIFIHIF